MYCGVEGRIINFEIEEFFIFLFSRFLLSSYVLLSIKFGIGYLIVKKIDVIFIFWEIVVCVCVCACVLGDGY